MKTKSSLKLPTLEAFEALSVRRRARWFLRWVQTKPARATYQPGDIDTCALCQFGAALTGERCVAGADYFKRIGRLPVNVTNFTHLPIIFAEKSDYYDPSTFGALARRLTKALATKP